MIDNDSFRVADVSFKFGAWFENTGLIENERLNLNEWELVNRFLDEEFEFTFTDTAADIVTCTGVEQHLLFTWMPEAKEKHLEIRALVKNREESVKILHAQILQRQIKEDERLNCDDRKIKKEKRKNGIINYSRKTQNDIDKQNIGRTSEEKKKPSLKVDCFVGMRYKRVYEGGVDFKKFMERMRQSSLNAWMKHNTVNETRPAKKQKSSLYYG